MNNKRFLVSIFSSIISVIVSLGVSFLLTPYLLNTLGKEAYSFYPLSNNFVSYMTIITLALNSMASRFITIEVVKGNEIKAHKYFSSVFYSNVILSLVLLLPMLLIIVMVDKVLNVPANLVGDVRVLFACVFASMIINLLFSVFGIATFAKDHMHWRYGREIGQNLLRALLLCVLFYFFQPTIIFLGIVTVAIAILNGSVQLVFTKKLMPEYHIHWAEFDRKAVIELVKSGIWNSINNLGSVLTMQVSILLANRMLGSGSSGDLSIIQTLPNFMTTVISAVYGVILSRIALIYAQGNKEKIIDFVKLSQKILGIVTTVPAVIIILFGELFFMLWVPNENAQYLQILSVITVTPILIHSSMWTVYGLNVTNNKLRTPALVLIGTGILNIFITVLLVKFTNWGVYAIAVSSSLVNSFFYLFFLPLYTAKKMESSGWTFYPHILRTFLFTILIVLLGQPLIHLLRTVKISWISFFASCFVAEVVGVIVYLFIVCSKQDRSKIISMTKSLFNKRTHTS